MKRDVANKSELRPLFERVEPKSWRMSKWKMILIKFKVAVLGLE